MKQFSKIFSFELGNYLKNKVFVGVTLFLVAAIALVMFFPRLKASFEEEPAPDTGGAAVDTENVAAGDLPVMLLKCEIPEDGPAMESLFAASFSGYSIRVTDADTASIKEMITSGEAECAFEIDADSHYTYYVNDLSIYDMNTAVAEETLSGYYKLKSMTQLGISPEDAAGIMTHRVTGTVENLGVDQAENYWYTYIMIFALYMVILLYGQMVATGVATEKSSRAMELLITSVKPVAMMFGKVLSACLAGLLQIVCIFGSAILFYSINKEWWGDNPIIASIVDMPPQLLGYMILFFVLGFLLFAFMFGAVG
ncbi:MAG: ABC transporter permease, partial [Clostridia bacterium]|nr:ABC transporter permease [Clostridia bacterium]